VTAEAATAVLAAAAGAWLVVRGPVRPRAAAHPPTWGRPGLVVTVAAPVLLALWRPGLASLAGVLAGAGLGAGWLLRQRAGRRRRQVVAGLVLECCELMAAELAAGQPPGRCLAEAARVWLPLAAVAEAFRMGADVPDAFRQVASHPGADDLRLVAAAWQVAARTGQGLADTVQVVAADLRAAQASRRVVEGELASARATARMVAGLPVLALAMGSGAGGDPWAFLFATPAGIACLAAGLALGLAGLGWIESIARGVDRC
jgi:tight adherence protein B